MPKNQSDPSDPMELVGVAVPASPGALDDMGRVFAEELLRMGYSAEQVLDFFQDPSYRGPYQVYQARGEEVVRTTIREAARRFQVRRCLWLRSTGQPGGAEAIRTEHEVGP